MKVAVKVRKSRESEFPPTIAVSSQQSAGDQLVSVGNRSSLLQGCQLSVVS